MSHHPWFNQPWQLSVHKWYNVLNGDIRANIDRNISISCQFVSMQESIHWQGYLGPFSVARSSLSGIGKTIQDNKINEKLQKTNMMCTYLTTILWLVKWCNHRVEIFKNRVRTPGLYLSSNSDRCCQRGSNKFKPCEEETKIYDLTEIFITYSRKEIYSIHWFRRSF